MESLKQSKIIDYREATVSVLSLPPIQKARKQFGIEALERQMHLKIRV